MSYPNTGAPEWAASQASPWASVNEASYVWDAFASRSIIEDRDLTAPPVSCANGARYLIDTPATGLWATHDGELAIAIGTNASNGWYYAVVATEGTQLFVRDESLLIEYDGAAWITAPGGVSFMDDLTDVTAPIPANGDILRYNGSAYVNDIATDIDGTLTANSDAKLATQKAVKTYVDSAIAGGGYTDAQARAALDRPIAGFFTSIPTADETLLLYTAVEAITFAANFAGSFGKIGINPTASFVLDVYKNPTFTGLLITGGTVIGTITIDTAGAFTFATTGGTSQSLAANDWLGVKGPTTPDATAACAAFNLLGGL